MIFKIDLPTVLLVYNTSLGAGALSILHVRRHSHRPRGLGFMASAYLLLAVGSLVAWRGELEALPPWMWTHGSLLLGTGGYALLWAGVRSFSGRRQVPWTIAVLPLGWLFLGVATGFPLENLLRAGAFHVTAAVMLFASTIELLRDHRVEPLPSRVWMAGFLALSASIYALRLAYIVSGEAQSNGFAVAFYVQMFCHFGIALMVASMSNERSEMQLEKAAYADPLTGVGNRRWLERCLPVHLPINSAIVLLDLDRFKQINDRHGHAAGDRVLVAFAQCLQRSLRNTDVLARTGGEEFVLYIPDVTQEAAMAIASRLRAEVAALKLYEGDGPISVTVSIGVAWVSGGAGTFSSWLRCADLALYEAKSSGRNRVVLASNSPGEVGSAEKERLAQPR